MEMQWGAVSSWSDRSKQSHSHNITFEMYIIRMMLPRHTHIHTHTHTHTHIHTHTHTTQTTDPAMWSLWLWLPPDPHLPCCPYAGWGQGCGGQKHRHTAGESWPFPQGLVCWVGLITFWYTRLRTNLQTVSIQPGVSRRLVQSDHPYTGVHVERAHELIPKMVSGKLTSWPLRSLAWFSCQCTRLAEGHTWD